MLGFSFKRPAIDTAFPKPKVDRTPATRLAPFTARDGENLALYQWSLGDGTGESGFGALEPRAVVLIVHGLGEHANRYAHVARRLLDWGFAVRAYDQRGHGYSGGARGVLPDETALLDDLAEIVDDTRLHCRRHPGGTSAATGAGSGPPPLPPPLKLILLGHSLGGLVVSRFVALNMRPVDGLVMSSPALDPGLNRLQKGLLAVMPRIAPNLCIDHDIDVYGLSQDDLVVRQYLADRLIHHKISLRLGRFIAVGGPATVAAAARWRTPTLLMYAGADEVVNPAGSRAFAAQAASSPAVQPGTVTSVCFEEFYHEIFNEVDTAPVFDALKTWLDARF